MSHADVKVNLFEFIRGELAPQEREAIDRHLASCGDCRRDAETLGSLLSEFPRMETIASFALDVWEKTESMQKPINIATSTNPTLAYGPIYPAPS